MENPMDGYYKVLCEDGYPSPNWFLLHFGFLSETSGQPKIIPSKAVERYATWSLDTGGFCVRNIGEFDNSFWPCLENLRMCQ